MSGADAAKYLHGVVTSTIVTDGDAPQAEGCYTGFLSAQGRVLHDAFIYPDTLINQGGELGQSFLIEVDANEAERLEKHIKRYKLRAKFNVRLLHNEEATVWQAWDDAGTRDSSNIKAGEAILQLKDPRTPTLGSRYITTKGTRPSLDLDQTDEGAYQVRRYLQGVPEGQEEMIHEHALPLESNMDLMNGINFRKGCYVGQELTIRTKHRGVVRKRILPCVVYGQGRAMPERLVYRPAGDAGQGGVGGDVDAFTAQMIPAETSIGRVGKKGRSAGKWLKGVGNIGLALCRLETMTDIVLPGETAAAPFNPEAEFFMTGPLDDGGTAFTMKIKAFVPEWLRQRLDEDAHA